MNKDSHLIFEAYRVIRESWEGWGDITTEDRENLKTALHYYTEYIASIYSKDLATHKLHFLNKIAKSIDDTDPSEAAKLLTHLSMEDRLSLIDYIDYNITEWSGAEKAITFLFYKHHEKIKPFKIKKPEIVLKGIAHMVAPNAEYQTDVSIDGIMDGQPKINLGYGYYTLDADFYKRFAWSDAKLCVDLGQKVYVTNIGEILNQAKLSIQKFLESQN